IAGTAAQIDFTLRIDVRADLAKIQAPTLILAPADDRFVPPVHSHELAEGIPGARLVTVSGGHAAIHEDHRQILMSLQEFLKTEM
ncbi:MAG: alpha/beta fold hydrolase, partial [Trebonia sp.]